MFSNILIIGLGNPGKQYLTTRHNVGFMGLDCLADHYAVGWNQNSRLNCEIASTIIGQRKLLLTKPSTYMNLSGIVAQSICCYYKIAAKNLFIVHDDIDLEVGRIKFKIGGGDGGHNGLKSISQHLGNNYNRIRIGVGRPPSNMQASDYVLAPFTSQERDKIITAIKLIVDNFELIITAQIEKFNSKIAVIKPV